MSETFQVYVVDDDPDIREWLGLVLEEFGYPARLFEGGEALLAAFPELEPGCILLDMRMPRRNGLSIQAELAAHGSTMPVIAMTGYGDVDIAVASMKLGTIEFLEKPFTTEALLDALALAAERLGEADR